MRSAGDEAWLCKPAPHIPELDGPEDEDTPGDSVVTTLPALPDSASAGGTSGGSSGSAASRALAAASHGSAKEAAVDPLVAWDYRQVAAAAAAARRRTSFRSVKEAVVRRMHCTPAPAGCVFGHAACGWIAMQFSRVASLRQIEGQSYVASSAVSTHDMPSLLCPLPQTAARDGDRILLRRGIHNGMG